MYRTYNSDGSSKQTRPQNRQCPVCYIIIHSFIHSFCKKQLTERNCTIKLENRLKILQQFKHAITDKIANVTLFIRYYSTTRHCVVSISRAVRNMWKQRRNTTKELVATAATREWLLELMTVTSSEHVMWRHADDGVTGETDVKPVVVVDVMTSCRWYIRSTNGNGMSAIIDTHCNYCLHREYEQYITGRTLRLF